jgi:hypothetical protein
MIRLARTEVEPHRSNTGEVDCLMWRDIVFSWKSNTNNVDEYEAKGYFVGISPKYMYEDIIIRADFKKNQFYLKTGYGKPITWVNLLGN